MCDRVDVQFYMHLSPAWRVNTNFWIFFQSARGELKKIIKEGSAIQGGRHPPKQLAKMFDLATAGKLQCIM